MIPIVLLTSTNLVLPSGDQLIITNSKGRALAVEEYSSTHGFLTVTPINEPGAAQVLASQMHIIQRPSADEYICLSRYRQPILICSPLALTESQTLQT